MVVYGGPYRGFKPGRLVQSQRSAQTLRQAIQAVVEPSGVFRTFRLLGFRLRFWSSIEGLNRAYGERVLVKNALIWNRCSTLAAQLVHRQCKAQLQDRQQGSFLPLSVEQTRLYSLSLQHAAGKCCQRRQVLCAQVSDSNSFDVLLFTCAPVCSTKT